MEFREPFCYYFAVWLPLFIAGMVVWLLEISWGGIDSGTVFLAFLGGMMSVTIGSAGLAVMFVEIGRGIRRLMSGL